MDPSKKNHLIDILSGEVLPRLVESILDAQPPGDIDLDRVYHRALGTLIDHLLDSAEEYPLQAPVHDRSVTFELKILPDGEIGSLGPQEVGELYERLRGFRVEVKPGGGRSALVIPSVRMRRNQGLFYTPITVVRHIVEQTLNTLAPADPAAYLDLRILDPAVGTGIFLGEVLEQVTRRVMAADVESKARINGRILAVKDRLMAANESGPSVMPVDDETAVRIHLLEHCLYGVDPDPVAVRVAVKHLVKTALGEYPPPPLNVRVRVANSLIGAGPLSPREDYWWPDPDGEHVKAYFGRTGPAGETVQEWKKRMGVFHWPMEFPEIFGSGRQGFDAVVGNPPYEIVSVKESGIGERRREQAYFRRMYRACRGKINTYRLMLERGLTLLRPGGALGFIVPATLLGDSTAQSLRRMIFDEAEIVQALILPEKARIFEGVTQALLILILRKGGRTRSINPTLWDGRGPVKEHEGSRVPRELIEEADFRVPFIRSAEEKALMEVLAGHPPFRGGEGIPAAGAIHQGELNLTVHRKFITAETTGLPLIRGEHVEPFRVVHPSARPGRLDWVRREFPTQFLCGDSSRDGREDQTAGESRSGRGRPWEKARIALGRVVNMATAIRLKAAPVPPGSFLGDMTNSVTDPSVPPNYLLGLLNSSLLNWRIKLTSTNNYLSAAEIGALPIPRISGETGTDVDCPFLGRFLDVLIARRARTMTEALAHLDRLPDQGSAEQTSRASALMIEWTVERIRADVEAPGSAGAESLRNVLDSLVVKLYSAVPYAAVLQSSD